jgi:SRSO17 transposase
LRRYRATVARPFAGPDGAFLTDAVSFPKRGGHSVGVQRQYGGALGNKAKPGHAWRRGKCAGAGPVWLLAAEPADGTAGYALSGLPADTTCQAAARRWKGRWPAGRGYPPVKEGLGLDHFEGRPWRGPHRHAALTFLAHGFRPPERVATPPAPHRRGKKGARGGPSRASGGHSSARSPRRPGRTVPIAGHGSCTQSESNGVVLEPIPKPLRPCR